MITKICDKLKSLNRHHKIKKYNSDQAVLLPKVSPYEYIILFLFYTSLIYFLIYAYLKISACRKFLLSLSSKKFVITENMNLTRFETWLTQNLVNFFPEPKVALTKKLVYCQMFEILFVLFLHSINIP